MNDVTQLAGQRIGPYVLRRKLGEGACGVVWLGHDPKLRRDVAIKLLQQWYSKDERAVKRFLREAQATAQLSHANVVAVYQVGESSGSVFIVMEWVDGGNLQDYVDAHGRMPWPEATRAIRDAAAGLGAAHEVGLIHRDIKPSNIMRTSTGAVKVVDFGLARSFEHRSDITAQGAIVGTPAFMSPEQCTGKPLDARSDLYSLMCTFYHLVCGQLPFGTEQIAQILQKQIHEPFPDARQIVPELPAAVCHILERGTKKIPAERFRSAAELTTELDAVLNDPSLPAPAPLARDGGTVLSPVKQQSVTGTVEISSEPKPLPPSNLPVQLTSFVGRKRELADVKDLLAKTRLLTLTGSGGSGKTRLSLEAATEALEGFPDGAWFVEFAALTDAALLPERVAAALNVHEEPGQPLATTLLNFLQPKSLLLVLDNCEHLRSAAAHLVESLLRGCPNLRILTSSREALRVAGETTYPVPSLSVPGLKDILAEGTNLATALTQYEQVRNYEAVQLFVERAGASQPRFALTDTNVLAVAKICQRLDGIPLAIELAAARVKMLTVQQIATRLDDSIQLLTRGVETALPRQQTLRATIDWSFELLTEKERALFRRLSPFAGGFALEAAEVVCAGPGIQAGEVLDLLSELVDKSLVLVAGLDQESEARYRLLETIRQYAGEKLAETKETETTGSRHREYFMQLAERGGPQLDGPDQGSWLERLEKEHDNLRVVLNWSAANDVPLGLKLGKALGQFWQRHGHWKEGRAWLENYLAKTAPVSVEWRSAALSAAGNLAASQGDDSQAEMFFKEQLALTTQANDQRGIADALHNLVEIAWKHGDYVRARDLEEQSLVIRRALGDKRGIAASLFSLATFAQEQTDFAKAARLHEESLALHRELGDVGIIATQLNNMGNMMYAQGNYEKARQLHEESLAIRRKIGDRSGICVSLNNLAVVAQDQGDYDRARPLLEESLLISRELGDKKNTAYALRNFGELMQLKGELAKALIYYKQSLTIFRELNDKSGIICCLEGFAMLACLDGPDELAARFFGVADALRAAIGARQPVSFSPAAYDKQLTTLRSKLGENIFDTAWQAGRAMTAEQAVAYALGEKT